MKSSPCNLSDFSSINEHANNLTKIIIKNAETIGMISKPNLTTCLSKPWFDSECVDAKRDINVFLKKCKKLNFEGDLLSQYNEKKKLYFSILKTKKEAHNHIGLN